MKKTNLLFAALMALLIFTSCKKDNVNPNPAPSPEAAEMPVNQKLLLSNSSVEMGTTTNFSYNANKTIKEMSWSNDQVKKTFTYANNHLIWVITSNNIKLMETDFTLLNGVAQTAVTKTWEMNGTPKDEYLTYYLYNNLGFLVKDSIFKNGQFAGAYRYEYNNDKDLSNRKDIDANGTIVGDIDFEYDLSHLDKTGSYGQFDNSGTNEIFPRKAKHMIKSRHSKLLNNVYTYTYTYDADGYVTHGQIKNTTNGETDTFNNTWQ